MEKLAENDFTYFYLRHVVIVVIAVATIGLPPVLIGSDYMKFVFSSSLLIKQAALWCKNKDWLTWLAVLG